MLLLLLPLIPEGFSALNVPLSQGLKIYQLLGSFPDAQHCSHTGSFYPTSYLGSRCVASSIFHGSKRRLTQGWTSLRS